MNVNARRPYWPSLDGLRCLAIMPIVWHHATTHPMPGVLGRGPIGVDLFFALSGFLITSLLLHERSNEGTISLAAFGGRRAIRIFPLYYVVLGLFVLHALLIREHGPSRDHFLASVPYFATYTSNWFLNESVDHPIVFAFAWSLATEEQFYVVWPPILRFLRGELRPALVMIALVALDQSVERGWLPMTSGGLSLRMLRSFATPIGLGSLLALACHSRGTTGSAIRLVLGQRWSSSVVLVLVVLAATEPWSIFTMHVLLTMLVGACALRVDHWLAPLFENRVVRHIGVVSYGIYLLNVPVVTAVRRVVGRETSAFVVFAIALPVVTLVATVAYQTIERPLLALKGRIRQRFSAHQV